MSDPSAGDLPAELASLAVELAEGAGRIARAGRRGGSGGAAGSSESSEPLATLDVDVKSTPTDLVTDVDRDVERWLRAQLAARRPDDRVLGEEGGEHGSGTGRAPSGIRWLVDPIDGTVNFVLGLPRYAVSVAAEQDGAVVAGCVHNPETGETFTAVRGRGASLRAVDPATGQVSSYRLGARRQVPLARSVIATGFGYDAAVRARQGAAVARLLPRIGDVRRMGSAALDLCTVAAGGCDGYFESGLHAWDWAAGVLIATEAGCLAAGIGGGAPSDDLVVVSAAHLLPDLVAALREVGADRVLDAG